MTLKPNKINVRIPASLKELAIRYNINMSKVVRDFIKEEVRLLKDKTLFENEPPERKVQLNVVIDKETIRQAKEKGICFNKAAQIAITNAICDFDKDKEYQRLKNHIYYDDRTHSYISISSKKYKPKCFR